MAEVKPLGKGAFLLAENHCPICAAATACQGFCTTELDLFRAFWAPELSSSVRSTSSQETAGAPIASHLIPSRERALGRSGCRLQLVECTRPDRNAGESELGTEHSAVEVRKGILRRRSGSKATRRGAKAQRSQPRSASVVRSPRRCSPTSSAEPLHQDREPRPAGLDEDIDSYHATWARGATQRTVGARQPATKQATGGCPSGPLVRRPLWFSTDSSAGNV